MSEEDVEQSDRRRIYLSAGVEISDPEALPGLSARIEPSAVPVSGVPFDTKFTTGQRVSCSLCGHRRNHFKGFVISFEDGRQAIVGIECGEKNLFADGAWQKMVNSSAAAKRKALFDARAAPAVAALKTVQRRLGDALSSIAPIEEFLGTVQDELPDLYEGLARAAKRGEPIRRQLTKPREVVGRDGEVHIEHLTYTKEFTTVPCPLLFSEGRVSGALRRLGTSLVRIEGNLLEPELSLEKQANAFKRLREVKANLMEIRRHLRGAERLYERSFWDKVAQWGRGDELRVGNYRVTSRWVRHSSDDYIYGEVQIPSSSTIDLSAIEDALNSWPTL